MPATIQVILQQEVDKLGKSGELVRVRPGFARNYLLPRELAIPATSAAVRRIEHEKAVALAKAEKAKKEARDVGAKLGALSVRIAQKAGEDGRLFGSVTAKDIESAVKAQGLTLDRKRIVLAEPIKNTGTYEIQVKLAPEVATVLKVEVVAKS
ncbi:MAG TPA: 50S ribosomal protein L9 [Polyangiaceae bacterium]|nr:50S ribosomal protein L9 [Polyangiaceae bacterium]